MKAAPLIYRKEKKTIIYETVNDYTTALTAAKSEKLEVISRIPPKDWVKLPDSEKFSRNFDRNDPVSLVYSYLGLHIREPKFQDKRTRQALAHLVDAQSINETLLYSLNSRIVGPISPSFPEDYHSDLPLYDYSQEKAKALLAEAGWKDENGNGILDRTIDGTLTDFKIVFNYNQGNDIRKNVGLAFQETARLAGISVEVIPMEWSVFLERLKQHKIEMWYGGWVMDPRPSDPKQIWHTDSYNGGSNYTGFGNAETDELIEAIRRELDPVRRSALYKQWQELLHEDVPYIFMYNSGMRMATHKRFDNLGLSTRDPGYYPGGFVPASGASPTAN
ncbi:ABC transporter substrate-binding protein [Chitinophagales bacterium]|nr:ABC transporter substrate-binding protein [Chitinophagales bacterium]